MSRSCMVSSARNFATLISGNTGEPEVSHLPLLPDDRRRVLRGHMARANARWRQLHDTPPLVAVFHGSHHYVSPAWYSLHPSMPTWNYAFMHACGVARLVEDRDAVESLREALVEAHESPLEPPWRMDLPADYLDAMINAIVCFEIDKTQVRGKFKLSQNRPGEDHRGVVAAMETLGSHNAGEVARLLRERLPG